MPALEGMEANAMRPLRAGQSLLDGGITSRRSQMALLAKEITRLERQRRLYTPRTIHTLPNEIIAQIFLEYAHDCRDRYKAARWDDFTQRPYIWMRVQHLGHAEEGTRS